MEKSFYKCNILSISAFSFFFFFNVWLCFCVWMIAVIFFSYDWVRVDVSHLSLSHSHSVMRNWHIFISFTSVPFLTVLSNISWVTVCVGVWGWVCLYVNFVLVLIYFLFMNLQQESRCGKTFNLTWKAWAHEALFRVKNVTDSGDVTPLPPSLTPPLSQDNQEARHGARARSRILYSVSRQSRGQARSSRSIENIMQRGIPMITWQT